MNIRDFAIGIVDTAPSPATSGTSLVLETGQGGDMPDVPFMAVVAPPGELPTKYNSELVEVTAVSTDTLTIVRAQGETSAQTILAGWILVNPILAQNVDGYQAPVGAISAFGGTTAPDGWLFCYGQAISRTTYADLFTAIGTTYGTGDGSTTFNVPDIRGRVIAGQDDMGGSSANRLTDQAGGLDGDVLGDTGGAETSTNTLSDSAYAQIAPQEAGGNSFLDARTITGVTSFDATVRVSSAGEIDVAGRTSAVPLRGTTDAGNNVQPTIILNYIIKATAPVTPPSTGWETGVVTLENKIIDANDNTVTNVDDFQVSRQDNTSNTTESNSRIEVGWGVIAISTAANNWSEAVTFSTAFVDKPIVILTCGGDALTASGTAYGTGANSIVGNWSHKAHSITNSGFTAHLHTSSGANAGANGYVWYQWMAIGN